MGKAKIHDPSVTCNMINSLTGAEKIGCNMNIPIGYSNQINTGYFSYSISTVSAEVLSNKKKEHSTKVT